MNKTLIVMVGLPGSGKSTAIKISGITEEKTVVISSDDYIEFVAKATGLTYNEVFSDSIGLANNHMDILLKQALKNKKNIVWDQTNLTIKKRQSILNKIPDDYNKQCIFMNAKFDEIKKRNSRNGKIIPDHVLEQMHKTMQPPTVSEGFHSVFVMNEDGVDSIDFKE